MAWFEYMVYSKTPRHALDPGRVTSVSGDTGRALNHGKVQMKWKNLACIPPPPGTAFASVDVTTPNVRYLAKDPV
jgi:hypothetical protein